MAGKTSFFLFIVDRAVSAVHHEAYKAKRIGGADDREKCRRIKEGKKYNGVTHQLGKQNRFYAFLAWYLFLFLPGWRGAFKGFWRKVRYTL